MREIVPGQRGLSSGLQRSLAEQIPITRSVVMILQPAFRLLHSCADRFLHTRVTLSGFLFTGCRHGRGLPFDVEKYVIWDNRVGCFQVRFVPYGAADAGLTQWQAPVESSGSRVQVERSLI